MPECAFLDNIINPRLLNTLHKNLLKWLGDSLCQFHGIDVWWAGSESNIVLSIQFFSGEVRIWNVTNIVFVPLFRNISGYIINEDDSKKVIKRPLRCLNSQWMGHFTRKINKFSYEECNLNRDIKRGRYNLQSNWISRFLVRSSYVLLKSSSERSTGCRITDINPAWKQQSNKFIHWFRCTHYLPQYNVKQNLLPKYCRPPYWTSCLG